MDKKIRLDELKNIAIDSKSDSDFLYTLHAYVSYIVSSIKLNELLNKTVKQEYESDTSLINEYKSEIKRESHSLYKEMKSLISEITKEAPEVAKYIKEYEELHNGTMIMSGDIELNLFGIINRALIAMGDSKVKEYELFAEKYKVYDSNGIQISWSWSKYYDKYEREKKRLERLEPTKPWYWWNQLAYFYEIFTNYEQHVEEAIKDKQYFAVMGYQGALEEVQDIIEGRKRDKTYYIHPNSLKEHLKRFHFYISEYIEKDTAEILSIKNSKPVFKKPYLHIADEKLKFKEGKNADLLEMLFKRKNIVMVDEAIAHIEGVDMLGLDTAEAEKYKKRFYSWCDSLASRIAKKTGINDLITYNKSSVRINKEYL